MKRKRIIAKDVSIRWSKCTNHLPDGVSPAPGTSHGFIIRAFANGVSLELLVKAAPSARSHGFGGGGVDILSVCTSRFDFSKTQSGDSIQLNKFFLYDACVHITRVLPSATLLTERKKLFSLDGQTPSRSREREREKAFTTKPFALKSEVKLKHSPAEKSARTR